jgi:hypothetical protein
VAGGVARAGNDDEVFVGNRAAMMGGAVAAVVRDGSAAWYNPAGLGGVERDQIDASASVYTLRLYSAPGYMASVDGDSKDASVREFFSVPAHVAYERRLAPNLGLGLAYFAPKSTNLLLREQLTTGDENDSSRWQLTLAQTEIQHRVVAALGFELSRVRLGASVVGGYDTGVTSVAVFGALRSGEQVTRTVSSSATSTYSRATLEVGLGAQWEVGPALHLAVFGRSPTQQLRRIADSQYSTAEGRQPMGAEAVLAGEADILDLDSNVELVRGGRVGLGLAYRVNDACLVSADADVQPALMNREADVERGAVFNARLGAYYQLRSALAVGVGLFTDRSPDRLTVGEISTAGDFYGGSLGLELGERHFLDPDERAESLLFSTIVSLRYAHSVARTTRILVDPSPTAAELFRSAPGDMRIHEISLYLGSGFAF